MKKNIPYIASLVIGATFLNACDSLEGKSSEVKPVTEIYTEPKPEIDKGTAHVKKIKGLYVFINSIPERETEYLTTVETPWFEQMDKFLHLKGKKIGEVLNDITSTVSFEGRMMELIDKVKNENPQAEAVVFTGKLSSCDVLKFK